VSRAGEPLSPVEHLQYMADVDEIVTGRRREGVFAGLMTFISKTAQTARWRSRASCSRLRFKLSAATHHVLMSEIARFKAGETTPASAKAVVEDLTGWRYEALCGKNSVGYRPRYAT